MSTPPSDLPGAARPQRPDQRLFFALYPDPATAASLFTLAQGLRQQLGLKGKPQEAARLHITLHFLGDFVGLPQPLVERARDAAAGLRYPHFELSFDHLQSFARHDPAAPKPLVLVGGAGLDALRDFRHQLGERLHQAGLRLPRKGSYTPHLTLLYDPRQVQPHAMAPLGWQVGEFRLMLSHLGQRRHEPLARWPLRPR